jgi:UDP-N-acetylglucosamine--N-acetylmuramyl-(pentapeptide) pyrophosphoryl-undecaprenol N-acetylglucosamine transferase
MKVLLCGGGTGGSVTALLAIAEEIRRRNPDTVFHFIGTKAGPERLLVDAAEIPFSSIPSGKLRRYASWRNITDLVRIGWGVQQSLRLLRSIRPDIVLATGSFVAVPVVWAAAILRIPSMTHQLDIRIGLANRLMLPFVRMCTVGFEESVVLLNTAKAVRTGNPFRPTLLEGDRERGLRLFSLRDGLPVVLCVGGGTGAQRLNQLVVASALKLMDRYQFLHITGKGKSVLSAVHPNYHPYEFLVDEMKDAFAVADIVVSRAGLATLTELALLGKPTILLPIPDSHQERNAQFFAQRQAVISLDESSTTYEVLAEQIDLLLKDSSEQQRLSDQIQRLASRDANRRIVDNILKDVPL